MSEEQEQEQDFKVTDKRSSFQEQGPEDHVPEEQTNEEASESAPQAETPKQEEPSSQASEQAPPPPLPEANFLTLLFSLYTQTQICFGVLLDPITQQQQKDLQQAKYHIDMLGMLKEKTQGNLTKEEEHALENILYEVRMAYVEVNK